MSQPMSPPPIHIRAVITWIAIFPLVTIGSFAIAPFANDWNPVLRAFVLSTLVVPLAVYFVVPQLTRGYAKLRRSWTQGRQTSRGSISINMIDKQMTPKPIASDVVEFDLTQYDGFGRTTHDREIAGSNLLSPPL